MKRVAVLSLVMFAVACSSKNSGDNKKPHGSGAGAGGGTAGDHASLPVLAPAPPLPTAPAGLPPPELGAITADQVALGEVLFFDGRLGADGTTSCATCHDPDADWSGTGRQPTAAQKPNLRRALPLSLAAWTTNLGWDGRYEKLDAHILIHIRGQLGDDPSQSITRIAALPLYRAHFQRAFGSAPDGGKLVEALTAFTRTRFPAAVAWDQIERDPGGSKDRTPAERELEAGYELFTGKAQCSVCHPPPLYTDHGYHRLGLIEIADEGRGRIDTMSPKARGAFRTVGLRGAARRATFFHDGSITTLEAAIDWHLAGGTGKGADKSIVDLPAVKLTAGERAKLIAFVAALSAEPAKYPRPLSPQ